MPDLENTPRFVFPRWANYLLPLIVISAIGAHFYLPTIAVFGMGPTALAVGYMPTQPVPFSHALHAGQLGMDCRYCHTTVEKAAFAAVPPTQTCMNCHANLKVDSPLLAPVRESWATGKPVEWLKVHDLADYAYFNHSAHVNAGVGCVSCHGRIDQMEVVYQHAPLSMAWCLDCHRAPEKHLRPKDQVTNMDYVPIGGDQIKVGLQLKAERGIRDAQYMTSCSVCHR